MLRYAVAVTAITMLTSCGAKEDRPRQTLATPNDEVAADSMLARELLEFERAWVTASTARDSAALNRAMADEWTITLADGRQSNKRRAIARWTAPRAVGVLSDTSIVDSVRVVRLGAHAAAVIGSITDIEVRAQRAETTKTRVTDIVVRRDGRWQAIVSHESVLPPGR